jgi:hypothetical protein
MFYQILFYNIVLKYNFAPPASLQNLNFLKNGKHHRYQAAFQFKNISFVYYYMLQKIYASHLGACSKHSFVIDDWGEMYKNITHSFSSRKEKRLWNHCRFV